MWDLFLNSSKLFFKGKLFREPGAVLRQWLIGSVATLVLLLVMTKIGLPLWLALLIASVGGGALQPWLFKDLKYA